MKRLVLVLFLAVFTLLPNLSRVQAASCSENGYTVVFINGIFTDLPKARADADVLQYKLGYNFGPESVKVRLGYNASHLAGTGDLIESYFPSFDTFDRDTILRQIHPDVTTRKILVTGYSQGAVYANKIYEYVTNNGESASAAGVYAVATPDSYVAGGGKYLTYNLDPVINALRVLPGFKPLPGNIDLIDLSPNVPAEGHSFTEQYLAGAADRIVSDIRGELSKLKVDKGSTDIGCFTPPPADLAYKTQEAILAVADPIALATKAAGSKAYQGAALAARVVQTFAKAAGTSVQHALAYLFGTPGYTVSLEEKNTEAGFAIVKALYGSSLSPQEVIDLSHKQGGAAILAFLPEGGTENNYGGEVLGEQTQSSITPIQMRPSRHSGGGSSITIDTQEEDTTADATTTPQEEPAPTDEQEDGEDTIATTTPDWSTDTTAPVSEAFTTLPGGWTNKQIATINYSSSDVGGSGVSEVRLYGRRNITGSGLTNWIQLATSSAPLGSFSINLNAVSYWSAQSEYYTVAVDRAGNIEAVPRQPDTRVFFDDIQDDVAFSLLPGTPGSSVVHVQAHFGETASYSSTYGSPRSYGDLVRPVDASMFISSNAAISNFAVAPNGDTSLCSFDLTPVAGGAFGVSVPAGAEMDYAGNPSALSQFSVSQESPLPAITITQPAQDGTEGEMSNFKFAFTVTSPQISGVANTQSKLECNISGVMTSCRPNVAYPLTVAEPAGAHTFTVYATDFLGRVVRADRTYIIAAPPTPPNQATTTPEQSV